MCDFLLKIHFYLKNYSHVEYMTKNFIKINKLLKINVICCSFELYGVVFSFLLIISGNM